MWGIKKILTKSTNNCYSLLMLVCSNWNLFELSSYAGEASQGMSLSEILRRRNLWLIFHWIEMFKANSIGATIWSHWRQWKFNSRYNTPPDEKLCHFRSRIFSKVSQKKKFISEVISFFSEVWSGWLFPEVRFQDTTRRGIKRKDASAGSGI